jgi:hypothetical protein
LEEAKGTGCYYSGEETKKASHDRSEDNNTETEDEGVEDEGDARAQLKPKKPAKPAAARATKPSAKARKPSTPVTKKIRSQGPSSVSATVSKPKISSL